MTSRSRFFPHVLAAICMMALAGVARAQYTVVGVLPNGTVILRGPNGGVRSYDVPPGTTFNADGKAGTAIADLKPGMSVAGLESGVAHWKSTSVMVHQELNAEIVAAAGNSLIIRGSNGQTERYTWKAASDITIVKDGQVVDASALRVGDRLTGLIVQKAAPGAPPEAAAAPAVADKAGADKAAADAAAKKAAADKAAADRAAAQRVAADRAAAEKAAADKAAADRAAAQAAADQTAAESASKAKKLPKTASSLPLAGVAGALSLLAGAGLTILRKSRPIR
jgi:hypothetical protein